MNFACADWDLLIEAEKDEESLKSLKTPSKTSKADNQPCKREAKAARKQTEESSCMSFAAYCEASASDEHELTQHLLESAEPVDSLAAAIDIDALMQKPVKTSPKKRVKRASKILSQTLGTKRSFHSRFEEPEPVSTKRPCQVANIDKAFGVTCCRNNTCC